MACPCPAHDAVQTWLKQQMREWHWTMYEVWRAHTGDVANYSSGFRDEKLQKVYDALLEATK